MPPICDKLMARPTGRRVCQRVVADRASLIWSIVFVWPASCSKGDAQSETASNLAVKLPTTVDSADYETLIDIVS